MVLYVYLYRRQTERTKKIDRSFREKERERNILAISAGESILKNFCWGLGNTSSRKFDILVQFFEPFRMMQFLSTLHKIENFEPVDMQREQ